MGNKLVLTGVTGPKSGGVLVEYISQHLDAIKDFFPGGITIICRNTSKTERIEKLLPSADIKRGSFLDSGFLIDALDSADTVVHLAGIQRSKELVQAAVVKKVHRLILIHTTGIYSKYKAAGEEYRNIDNYVEVLCNQNSIKLTILRPTMIYGNVHDNNVVHFIKMVDRLPIMPVVNGARYGLQPVHYKDLGKAYYDVLMHEEQTANQNYTLSGGEAIQLRDMLAFIGECLGKKVKFISCPFWIAYTGACIIHAVSFGRIDYREKVQRLCEPRVFSYEKANKDFGYSPRTFREGVIEEIKEYKELK